MGDGTRSISFQPKQRFHWNTLGKKEAGAMSEKKISASDLGIDLSSKQETEYFKWFLACLLFGKPIQQEVARRTYLEFVKDGLTSPAALLQAGWEKLVNVLDTGHYTRYD